MQGETHSSSSSSSSSSLFAEPPPDLRLTLMAGAAFGTFLKGRAEQTLNAVKHMWDSEGRRNQPELARPVQRGVGEIWSPRVSEKPQTHNNSQRNSDDSGFKFSLRVAD
ncbi:unnamed protein product [Leuciscus chuanchicus]